MSDVELKVFATLRRLRSPVAQKIATSKLRHIARQTDDSFLLAVLDHDVAQLHDAVLQAAQGDQPISWTAWDLLDEALSHSNKETVISFLALPVEPWSVTFFPRTFQALESGDIEGATLSDAPEVWASVVIRTIITKRIKSASPLTLEDIEEFNRRGPSVHKVLRFYEEPSLEITPDAYEYLVRSEAWGLLLRIIGAHRGAELLGARALTDANLAAAFTNLYYDDESIKDKVRYIVQHWLKAGRASTLAPVLQEALPAALEKDLVENVYDFLTCSLQIPRDPHSSANPGVQASSTLGVVEKFSQSVRALEVLSSLLAGQGKHPPSAQELSDIARLFNEAGCRDVLVDVIAATNFETVDPTTPLFRVWADMCWSHGSKDRVLHQESLCVALLESAVTELGENEEYWVTFASLLPTWDLSFSDLLNTTRQLAASPTSATPHSLEESAPHGETNRA